MATERQSQPAACDFSRTWSFRSTPRLHPMKSNVIASEPGTPRSLPVLDFLRAGTL
jgi:hypothetical protein